ncbi:MAG: hypothetical protein CVT89_03570 [Candidatus Altiarchaeales archaeon HGW-Altiarchaeales-2]|nr:MAG: hypothetical protein CVT89_03570 [Candidatus Altiarchaeales archaeon HGW-Altiarchaeales-2]
MNEINKKQKELETNYEIYSQDKSLKYVGMILLLGVISSSVAGILNIVFNIPIHFIWGMMFPYILISVVMSIITGKIALKTRNITAIVWFILFFPIAVGIIIMAYFVGLNKLDVGIKLYIPVVVISIFVLY